MPIKAFLDSPVFLYGLQFIHSNSAHILELLNEDKLEAHVNMRVLEEVARFHKTHYNRQKAYLYTKYLLQVCKIVYEDDYKEQMRLLKGKIKDKDLPHLAVTRALGLKYLVSFDRDFTPFPEYKTPKQFLKKLGLKSKETEY